MQQSAAGTGQLVEWTAREARCSQMRQLWGSGSSLLDECSRVRTGCGPVNRRVRNRSVLEAGSPAAAPPPRSLTGAPRAVGYPAYRWHSVAANRSRSATVPANGKMRKVPLPATRTLPLRAAAPLRIVTSRRADRGASARSPLQLWTLQYHLSQSVADYMSRLQTAHAVSGGPRHHTPARCARRSRRHQRRGSATPRGARRARRRR
jgi:hypothetical protein